MAATYHAAFLGVSVAPNACVAGIFNGSGSGKVLRIKRIIFLNTQSAAIGGTLTAFEARRSTAQSGGSPADITKMDTNSANLPAQVQVVSGPTATSVPGLRFFRVPWSMDEINVSILAIDEIQAIPFFNIVFNACRRGGRKPIVLREGEGLDIRHIGNTSTGSVCIFIEFTSAGT